MGFVQAAIGSILSLMVTASVFFIAYKAMAIGNDMAEMKELLKDIRKGSRGGEASFGSGYPAPLPMADAPSYDSDPVGSAVGNSDFRLPTPISRRLDAERSGR